MAVRDIYLRIETIDDYSPVDPVDKALPPIQYRRDCMVNEGHPDGVIPDAEVAARSLTALVYREYLDPDYLIPKVDKLVSADVNEPVFDRRVPGTVIYASPGETLHIHVFNADINPHSFHTHGLRYGIESDGAWPFGVESSDELRSDEICPGQSWTYIFEVDDSHRGAWAEPHVRHVDDVDGNECGAGGVDDDRAGHRCVNRAEIVEAARLVELVLEDTDELRQVAAVENRLGFVVEHVMKEERHVERPVPAAEIGEFPHQ